MPLYAANTSERKAKDTDFLLSVTGKITSNSQFPSKAAFPVFVADALIVAFVI